MILRNILLGVITMLGVAPSIVAMDAQMSFAHFKQTLDSGDWELVTTAMKTMWPKGEGIWLTLDNPSVLWIALLLKRKQINRMPML